LSKDLIEITSANYMKRAGNHAKFDGRKSSQPTNSVSQSAFLLSSDSILELENDAKESIYATM